jgi:hypothetical protein
MKNIYKKLIYIFKNAIINLLGEKIIKIAKIKFSSPKIIKKLIFLVEKCILIEISFSNIGFIYPLYYILSQEEK